MSDNARDDAVVRELVGPAHAYFTPGVQALRRAFLRCKAAEAAELLADAAITDDPDELTELVGRAASVVIEAERELLKAYVGG